MEDRVRSWIAMAGAADARFTLELLPLLRERAVPTLLLWGEDGFSLGLSKLRREGTA